MTVIGLTGLCCSGKSSVAKIWEDKGAIIIDLDAIGHKVRDTKEIIENLTQAFSSDILDNEGKVIRSVLAQKAFSTKQSVEKLNEIMHSPMKRCVKEKLSSVKAGVCIIDSALLVEMGLYKLCDSVILIDASFSVREKRAAKRSLSKEDLQARDKVQMSTAQKGAQASETLINNGDKKDLLQQSNCIWRKYTNG